MNKLLKISGVVFSLLLLAVVSATAQVKKKTIVRKTSLILVPLKLLLSW